MRIVVAGASGFIGGHLIDELLRHEVEPIAMVRLSGNRFDFIGFRIALTLEP